ncbi:MAG: hypothetical protein ACI8ZB_004699 [Desulforhopalus sp.]|jgi:hypothetical protein
MAGIKTECAETGKSRKRGRGEREKVRQPKTTKSSISGIIGQSEYRT